MHAESCAASSKLILKPGRWLEVIRCSKNSPPASATFEKPLASRSKGATSHRFIAPGSRPIPLIDRNQHCTRKMPERLA